MEKQDREGGKHRNVDQSKVWLMLQNHPHLAENPEMSPVFLGTYCLESFGFSQNSH